MNFLTSVNIGSDVDCRYSQYSFSFLKYTL